MISVIMLTYNREKYVEHMINDILHQTLQDFEFVIVNNGSTDGTAQLLARYAQLDSRIKVVTITKEEAVGTLTMSGTGEVSANTSIGRARNIGFRASTGEYIAYVDDDDRVEPDYLEFLYGLLQEEDADIAMCGASEGDGVERHAQCLFDEKLVLTGHEAVELLLGRKYIRAGMPTKMYRRSIIEAFPFEEKYKNEDIHTQYKYLLAARKMVAWGQDKYYCYRHGGNISGFTGSGNASGWTYETMHNYLGAYRRRAAYVAERAPELTQLTRYTVFSFMIDMVAIVEQYDLTECRELEREMVEELRAGAEEFLAMPQIKDVQIQNMKAYVKS